MKKIFSLAICAMFATLSFAQLLDPVASIKKATNPAAEKVAISAPAALAAPARVQQAVGDTIEVEVNPATPKYYGAPDYDWFFYFISLDDSLEFRFDILNQPAAGLPMNVTYTLDSMDVAYSWGKHLLLEGKPSITYTSVSFVVTPNAINPKAADYDIFVTSTENITYHLTYIAVTPFVKKGEATINVPCDSVMVVRSNDHFQIKGYMPDTAAYKKAIVTFYGDQLVGTYTPADSYGSSYNWIVKNDSSTVEPWCGYYVSATVADNKAVAVLDGEDSIRYTIVYPLSCPEYDTVFTSNANILAGTNSYLTEKINIDGTQYNAYKIGTSKNAGNLSVTLPKGATKLSFHAVAWNKENNALLHVGDKVFMLDANTGISGNSPYTYAGEGADGHFFEIEFEELAEADTITFSADKRIVFYGVNVVAPYSGVYAFTAQAASYDLGFGTLAATDNKSKHSVDANTAYFGDENGYVKFTQRLKVGAKSSADNFLTFTPTSKGTVKLYARTGSNSDTTRNVVVKHDANTLVNHVVRESEAVEHKVYADHKNQTIKVYPAIEFEVVAGETYEITYPTNSINFYGIAINYFEPEAYVDTVVSYSVTELLANAPAVQTLIQVSGVVTKIESLSYSVQDKTAANIWVAAAAGDSAEATTVEFYQCLALGGEGFTGFSALNDTAWMGEKYIAVGDTVKADGFYALYKEQAEIAANTDKTWYPQILSVKHYVAPVYTYYFKHPWNGGEWTWKEAADTTFLGHEASYVVAQWGDNGFNFHTEAADAGAQWYVKDLIGTATPDGNVGIGYPAVGTEVTFICLHDDYEQVVGGGRAWIVYNSATALENTAAGVKAVKIIENGQVVIIRDGKKFNLMGAEL